MNCESGKKSLTIVSFTTNQQMWTQSSTAETWNNNNEQARNNSNKHSTFWNSLKLFHFLSSTLLSVQSTHNVSHLPDTQVIVVKLFNKSVELDKIFAEVYIILCYIIRTIKISHNTFKMTAPERDDKNQMNEWRILQWKSVFNMSRYVERYSLNLTVVFCNKQSKLWLSFCSKCPPFALTHTRTRVHHCLAAISST